MTKSLGFPSPAAIAAQTPPDRDRAIDVIRIVALVGVVVGHTVMATSIIRDDSFTWGNLLTTSVIFQALTWVLQIMPLFFFAGVAASVTSWHDGIGWGGWLMKRCTRLYRPVFFYLAFWASALFVLHQLLPARIYESIAGISTQLLWFLGAYVLVLATVPLLSRITTVARLAAGIAGVITLIAVVDAVRLNVDGMALLGFVNMAVWLVPGMLGVAYRRHLLTTRAALGLAAGAFGVNIALLTWGPYELSLVGIEGQRLANMFPPSLLMAGHAIILCGLAIALAPAINRWAQRPRVWWLAAIGNSGAMTLYLWHMPALLGMHLVFDFVGLPRFPGEPGFVVLSISQLALMAAVVAALFVALRPLENNPLPGWDGSGTPMPGARSAAVGTLLCIAGAATLASVKWGLKDEGIYLMAVMLTALVCARILSHDRILWSFSGGERREISTNRSGDLAALAAELPPVFDRPSHARLLGSGVLVLGPARRLRVLSFQGFTELALGLVVVRDGVLIRVLGRGVFNHYGSLTRPAPRGHRLKNHDRNFTWPQRTPGGIPYRCDIAMVRTTRRSVTMALR